MINNKITKNEREVNGNSQHVLGHQTSQFFLYGKTYKLLMLYQKIGWSDDQEQFHI